MPMPWVFFILLLIVLPIYIIAEYKAKSPWGKLALKAACSLLFILTATAAMAVADGWQTCFGWFMAAFLLSAAGDVLLSWPVKQSLTLGLGAFFLAQCAFTVAFCLRWGLSGWDALIYTILAGGALITLKRAPGMDYGPMRKPVMCYALALSAMAAKAVSGDLAGSAGAWVAAAGGLLFYASDVILCFQLFNRKKLRCLVAWNLITYYLGQGLLAISLMFS